MKESKERESKMIKPILLPNSEEESLNSSQEQQHCAWSISGDYVNDSTNMSFEIKMRLRGEGEISHVPPKLYCSHCYTLIINVNLPEELKNTGISLLKCKMSILEGSKLQKDVSEVLKTPNMTVLTKQDNGSYQGQLKLKFSVPNSKGKWFIKLECFGIFQASSSSLTAAAAAAAVTPRTSLTSNMKTSTSLVEEASTSINESHENFPLLFCIISPEFTVFSRKPDGVRTFPSSYYHKEKEEERKLKMEKKKLKQQEKKAVEFSGVRKSIKRREKYSKEFLDFKEKLEQLLLLKKNIQDHNEKEEASKILQEEMEQNL